jgi:hypothetical protein
MHADCFFLDPQNRPRSGQIRDQVVGPELVDQFSRAESPRRVTKFFIVIGNDEAG